MGLGLISQPWLHGCNYLQIDRATTIEHTACYVLGLPTLPLLPGTSFPYRLFTSAFGHLFWNQGSVLAKNI